MARGAAKHGTIKLQNKANELGRNSGRFMGCKRRFFAANRGDKRDRFK